MAQKIEGKDERPLQSYFLKNFLAVNTTNSRTAIPQETFYNLENIQPIGYSNIHTVNDIGALIHDFGGDAIYWDANCNINGNEYLIQASTSGKLFATNLTLGTVVTIATSGTLSGNSTRMVQWQNSNILIIDSSGYFQWDGAAGSISAIVGTGAPSNGVAIAVYQNRVWVAQGRLILFSAPASFSDFTTASGGGSTSLVDSTLRSSVQALLAANGYLYIFGVSSIDAISDLYIPAGASPPTPNFTKLNLTAIVGTDQPGSIILYGRLVLFANRYGVWSLYGATVTSVSGSDPNNTYQSSIDGTWQYVDFQQTISAGQCLSNNLLCAGFLIKRLNDPTFGSNTVIAMYQGNAAGGRWWFANYGAATRVQVAYVNNAPALFAYIGNKLFQLFADTTSCPAWTLSTGLWDMGDPITQKEMIRAGFGITIFKIGTGVLTFSLDTSSGNSVLTSLIAGQITWVNNSNQIVTWVNNFSQPVTWITGQFLTYWGKCPPGFSKNVGFSLSGPRGVICEVNSILCDYKLGARWTGN